MKNINFATLAKINAASTASAGPRYAPADKPGAPNIEIQELLENLDGLIASPRYIKRLMLAADEVKRTWDYAISTLPEELAAHLDPPSEILRIAKLFANAYPGALKELLKKLSLNTKKPAEAAIRLSEEYREKEKERRRSAEAKKEDLPFERSDEERFANAAYRYWSAVRDLDQFTQSIPSQLCSANKCLLTAPWGMGKTHFMVDLSQRLVEESVPAVVILAKDLERDRPLSEAIAKRCGCDGGIEELLSGLEKLASGRRALLMVDGINEGDRARWKKELPSFIRAVRNHQHVALMLSCRDPYQEMMFTSGTRRSFVEIRHPGFEDVEFDAQTEFLKFYKIPVPQVPLFLSDFARPLTLDLFCQAFAELPTKEKRKGFEEFACGQRGLTFVLEGYVRRRSKLLAEEISVSWKILWNIMKGSFSNQDPANSGLAAAMAERSRNWLWEDEVVLLLQKHLGRFNKKECRVLVSKMVQFGLLVEEPQWDRKTHKLKNAVAFPYERLGDHLVSRYLLGRYLSADSSEAISKSFTADTPLAKVFHVRGGYQFERPGWAEALILEFPERVMKRVRSEDAELIKFLPSAKEKIGPYLQPFIDGLFWRPSSSFSEATKRIINHVMTNGSLILRGRMLEALISCACRKDVPIKGTSLYSALEKYNMRERDLSWTEIIRNRYEQNVVERILRWLEGPVPPQLQTLQTESVIAVLSAVLTTTDRYLRDRVTRALVYLGEREAGLLFNWCLRSLSFNDPYVPERMLAACYGVVMSRWATSDRNFHKLLRNFAREIVGRVFSKAGDFATSHTLSRDYALGIVSLAQRVGLSLPTETKRRLEQPFSHSRSPFHSPNRIAADVWDKVASAVSMDFDNYTIGSLVEGRANYDNRHPRFKSIKKQIAQRMLDLGYDARAFKSADEAIAHAEMSHRKRLSGKIDRYGKKYSWIAFFEMRGLLEAKGRLEDRVERCADCDIDPTFPKRPQRTGIDIGDLFKKAPLKNAKWLSEGPVPQYSHLLHRTDLGDGLDWTLVDAYVPYDDPNSLRRGFGFIRGVFISAEEVSVLRGIAGKVRLSRATVPELPQDLYTYAGEVPWSRRFCCWLRTKSGALKPSKDEAFVIYKPHLEKLYVGKAWQRYYELRRSSRKKPRLTEDLELFRLANRGFRKKDQIRPITTFLYGHAPTRKEAEQGWCARRSQRKAVGIRAEVAAARFSWESHHSEVNDFSGFPFPSPWLCRCLNLTCRGREVELFDEDGIKATRLHCEGTDERANLLYIRTELLEKYMSASKKVLVWASWGERQLKLGGDPSLRDEPKIRAAWDRKLTEFGFVQVYGDARPIARYGERRGAKKGRARI